MQPFWKNSRTKDYESAALEERVNSIPADTALARLLVPQSFEEFVIELLNTVQHDWQAIFCGFTLFTEQSTGLRFDYLKFNGEKQQEISFKRLAQTPPETTNRVSVILPDNGVPYRCLVIKLAINQRGRAFLCVGPRLDGEEYLAPEIQALEALAEPLVQLIIKHLQNKEIKQRLQKIEEENARLTRHCTELQLINQKVVKIVEEERNQVARQLQHDLLEPLTQIINQFEGQLSNLTGREEFVWQLTYSASKATNSLINKLRPSSLDQLGLAAALMGLIEDIKTQGSLTVRLRVAEQLEQQRLAPQIELCLYRVAQEALQNIIEHAKATHVTITLSIVTAEDKSTKWVRLAVLDDGIGFEIPPDFEQQGITQRNPGSLGLAGVQQRLRGLDGRFKIRTSPGAGTMLEAELPLGMVNNTY